MPDIKNTVYKTVNGSWNHRDTKFNKYIDKIFYINEFCMMVAQLESDSLWWIIVDSTEEEENTIDIGPFNTLDEAIVYARLIGDNI